MCAYFTSVGMATHHWVVNGLAMMFGDDTGSFIGLTCLWLVLFWLQRNSHNQNMSNL